MAAIEFRCPACGHATKVTKEYCGQTGPCVHCGATVTVPRAPSEPAAKGESGFLGRAIALVFLTGMALLFGVLIAMTGIKLIEPIARGMVVSANHRESKGHLARIAAALLAYEKQYGSFPPPAIRDKGGQALHSWRVLILPFLGPAEKSLYESYRMDEPWNGPTNFALHARMPEVYGSPNDAGRNPGETNYFVITGKRGLFHDGKTNRIETPSLDPKQTVLVVEVLNQTGTSWLEPRDFPASSLDGRINGGMTGQLNGVHDGGIYIATADGETHFIQEEASPDELRAAGILEE